MSVEDTYFLKKKTKLQIRKIRKNYGIVQSINKILLRFILTILSCNYEQGLESHLCEVVIYTTNVGPTVCIGNKVIPFKKDKE